MTGARGFDASSIQHPNGAPLDAGAAFAYLRALGNNAQPFAVIKLTEGAGYVNPFDDADIRALIAAGFAVAAYQFDHPATDAGAQLAFLRAHNARNLPTAEDLEVTDGWPMAQVATEGQAELAGMGPRALLYSYPSFLDSLPGAPWGHGLWLADPNHPPGQPSRPCVIQQYSAEGRVPGIPAPVDFDVFLGTPADFARYFDNVAGGTGGPLTEGLDDMGYPTAHDPVTGGQWVITPDGGCQTYDGAPYIGSLNTHPDWHADPPAAADVWTGDPTTGADGGKGAGLRIITRCDTHGLTHAYRLRRDGSDRGTA